MTNIPMNIQELLYFKRPTTITTYSNIPNDIPDISRLIKGQKPFPSANANLQKIPKKTIIDVNMFCTYTQVEQKKFNQTIKKLQVDGLSFYYYQNNQLRYYDIETITIPTIPTPLPTVEELSQILNIPVDEVFILNEQYARLFMTRCDAISQRNLSEFFSLRTIEKISSIFIKTKQPLSEVDSSICAFPNIKHLTLTPSAYEELLHLKDYSNLSSLETIDLDLSGSNITSTQLIEILAQININVLQLRSCKNIAETIPYTMIFSQLQQLELNRSPITSISLANILKQASNLELLNLTSCLNIKDPLPEDITFPKLEDLNVSDNCSISAASLTHILANSPQLKRLDLIQYNHTQDIQLPYGIQFTKLEELYFYRDSCHNTSINNRLLVDFLSRSPNIKRLSIEINDQTIEHIPDDLDLYQLEELNIKGLAPCNILIYELLTNTRTLKKLKIKNLILDEPTSRLSMLEELKLQYTYISTTALNDLLSNGHKLKLIELNSCPKTQITVSNPLLPDLEIFALYRASINANILYKILITAKKLKNLSLIKCTSINGTFSNYLTLPDLEELDLLHTVITNDCLLKIIAKSPKLKKLRLHNSEEFLDAAMIAGLKRGDIIISVPDQILDGAQTVPQSEESQGITLEAEEISTTKSNNKQNFFNKNTVQTSQSLQITPTNNNTLPHKKIIDANTEFKENTYQVRRIFIGKPTSPAPEELRYEVFDSFSFNENNDIQQAFILHSMIFDLSSFNNIAPHLLSKQPLYEAYSTSTTNHYFCRTNLYLTSNWQPLPSAFADEELEQFYIKPEAYVELAKDTTTNFYYIRLQNQSAEAQDVICEMLLTRQNPNINFTSLPKNIRDVAKFCRGFRQEKLQHVLPNASAQDLLNAIIQQRTGSCRHRSIVFMYLMKQQYPAIPVRLISNNVHIFAEVNYNGLWFTCDLGGYPAHMVVNDSGLPEYRVEGPRQFGTEEVYEQTISNTMFNRVLTPDFFQKAQNLTTLNLKHCSHLTLSSDLSMLDTLNIIHSHLTAAELQNFFMLTPKIKTFSMKHCTIRSQDFNLLDFSCLKKLEFVSLSGIFIPNIEAVTRLAQTAPKAHWIIESDNLFLESIDPMFGSDSSNPLPNNVEIRNKPRQLPARYFVNRNRNLNAKKDALHILQQSDHPTSVRKTLINAVDVEAARISLQKAAINLKQLYYYIDTTDELKIAGPYIRREGQFGYIENSYGGPLYDFIMSERGVTKNIIINYNVFQMSDFASFNSLLDETSTLDNINLPHDIHIIGILNQNNQDVYKGDDFYSRFDEFGFLNHEEHFPDIKLIPLEQTENTEIIELCGGLQWESKLIGHWLLEDGRLIFKDGLLLEALKDNKSSFSWNNAPIHNSSFVRFLHDLILHERIIHQGHDYGPLPTDFHIVLTEGIHIPEKEKLLTLATEGQLTPQHVILNQMNLSQFLGSYILDESSCQLIFKNSLIEEYANKVLSIYLTSSLSIYTWMQLLEDCRKHNTILETTLSPGVTFPPELGIDITQVISRPQLTKASHTVFNLTELTERPDIIIDVGDLQPDELLATFKCNGLNTEKQQFAFTPIQIYPWEALNSGKTVLLKGEWSQELADAVQIIMFERIQNGNPPGKLIVFSNTPQKFKALMAIKAPIQLATKKLDQIVDYEHRLDAVTSALTDHPFVLITGATGIGKTHFISRTWRQAHPACYYGEKQIIAFLEDVSPYGLITLYLNEANLSNKDWSMFEGLFNDPPAIFYNNHYYTITDRHKIIFDGNPITYGGERHTPRLFQNHPYQLHFQPLPSELIKNMIGLDDYLSTPILEIVMYMTSLDPGDTLITPREIKMIGYLVKSNLKLGMNPEKLARYFAYTICKNHVPRTLQNEFENLFKVDSPFTIEDMQTLDNTELRDQKYNYLLNNTNLPAAIALQGHLMVREERRKVSMLSLEIGLGGLVIEGESGAGKSQLILNQLIANGYKKDIDFIHIPAKSKPKAIKTQLLNGFNRGLIVVIDEINSLPMPEQLLNALLEGHDLGDNPPQQPGFLLLGTQNPITYRGRLKTTNPLEHRLQKVILPNYTTLEKKRILETMGLPLRIAQDIIGEYLKRSDLSFRDVIKIAKLWLQHNRDKLPIQINITPIQQVGSICKIVAIATIENYYSKLMNYASIPLWSEKQDTISIRKIAKANGSSQGELLEFQQWRRILDDLGFISEEIDFNNNISHFVAEINNNLQQGNIPLIAFPIDEDSELPNPETKHAEDTEHAAVISGYNWQTDAFTLLHWGKSYEVDATTLFNAAHKLVNTRGQEFYTKNPAYQKDNKWHQKKYLPSKDGKHHNIARTSIVPQENTGFKAKLLIVHRPDKEYLLQQREKLNDIEHQKCAPSNKIR